MERMGRKCFRGARTQPMSSESQDPKAASGVPVAPSLGSYLMRV